MRLHLYKRPYPSVGRSVGRLVGWSGSVMLLSKSMKNGLLRVLNGLDSAGRGKTSDEEEGGTRRDEEIEKMKKLFKKMKNEKVAKERIIGLAGSC